MIRNSLFEPGLEKCEHLSDQDKKRMTYLKMKGRLTINKDEFKAWYEATHWKELGYGAPSLYSMLGKLPDGIHKNIPSPIPLADTTDEMLDRIILW